MVKRDENGVLGAAWRWGHGISEGYVVLGLSSRVRRAASSLQMQSEAPIVARYSAAKTAL